jgi:hypothetical protein
LQLNTVASLSISAHAERHAIVSMTVWRRTP